MVLLRKPFNRDEVFALARTLCQSWSTRLHLNTHASFLDAVVEGQKTDDGGFDAEVAIATGELVKLIPDLVKALGGYASAADPA